MGASDIEQDRPGCDPAASERATALATELGRVLRAIDGGLLVLAVASGIGAVAGSGTGLLALAASAGWLSVQSSQAGHWLRSVRRLEWQRARALVATGLARAEHRRGVPGASARAGDAYEREGRLRRALRMRSAEPARTVGWLMPIAERTGRVL